MAEAQKNSPFQQFVLSKKTTEALDKVSTIGVDAPKIEAANVITGQVESVSNGVIAYNQPKNVADGLLPEGLDMATVDKVGEFHKKCATALAQSVSEVGIDAMTQDAELATVTGTMPVGKYTKLEATVHRSKDISYPKDGQRVTEARPGHVDLKVTSSYGKSSSSHVTAVRTHAAALAKQLLSK